jgi:hypothetical protein
MLPPLLAKMVVSFCISKDKVVHAGKHNVCFQAGSYHECQTQEDAIWLHIQISIVHQCIPEFR